MVRKAVFSRDDLEQTHDGLKAECPNCRRKRFLASLMTRECRCGCGPWTMILEADD